MSTFYNSNLEAFYSIDHIDYFQKPKNGKVVQYCYSGTVNIQYRNNPTDPQTNRLSKNTTCAWSECYPVDQFTKQSSERAFERSLIQHCMSGAEDIGDDKAKQIQELWSQSEN